MRKPITKESLRNSACAKLNPHLFEKPKSTKVNKTLTKHFKRKSAGLDYISKNLVLWCNENGLKLHEEYRFDTVRKFRFDFAIEKLMVAIEFEGGIFEQNGGHNRADHYTKDTDKYRLAAKLGWKVFRYTALNYEDLMADLKTLV